MSVNKKKWLVNTIIYVILFIAFIFASPYHNPAVVMGLFPVSMFYRVVIFGLFTVQVWYIAYRMDNWWAKEEDAESKPEKAAQ